MAINSWLPAARKLLSLALLVLLAVTSANAARPMLQASSTTAAAAVTGARTFSSTSALGSPHRVERKLFSWDGVTADQIMAGSLGTIEGVYDDGEVTVKVVEIFMNAGYNVMVIKKTNLHLVNGDPSSAEVKVAHFFYDPVFVVYYKQGPFSVENMDDGGFQNWAFGGVWERKEQEEEERREEEEMAVRVEAAIRERVEAELACERVQQQVAAMAAAGRQKLREEVQAQLEREKLALLADARQKEEQKRREQEELEQMLAENQRKVEEAQRRAAEERAREEGLRHKEREAVNAVGWRV
ncbi:unnamed protein product [Closterium sp. Yama58-4]|nr:unnamed protein product [Closterium sp. Yama58-4]